MSGFDAPPAFDVDKQALLDAALDTAPRPQRVADLGGVWNVAGAYARYARVVRGVSHVTLVDSDFDDATRRQCRHDGVAIVEGLLGDPTVIRAVGSVDLLLLFDVLLHQVAPDWDELLAAYAAQTDAFAIVNPQWCGDEPSFRLVDLGRERYFELVPHAPTEAGYDRFFDRLEEPFVAHGRRVRDVHYAWQWAITDADLCAVMARLGFAAEIQRDFGPFGPSRHFARRGFVFRRR